MDLRERLGELLLIGFADQEINASLAEHIRTLRPAGLIFFRRNISTPEQLVRLTREIQTFALQELGRPLLLAVDQEGGTVARLPRPFTQLPDAFSLGGRGCQSVSRHSRLAAREMRLVGLNLNLAPVLDIDHPASARIMQRRSFGGDASLVARCGIAAVTATQSEGVLAAAKHFPGLGRARKDPHVDLPTIPAGEEELLGHDVLPFRAAIQADVACVMTSHTVYPGLDPEAPATFSRSVLTGLLRRRLGFTGLIVTDDLDMGAVTGRFSPQAAAIAALRAGADLLLICHDAGKMHLVAQGIHRAVEEGLLDAQDLGRSLTRLEDLRQRYVHPLRLPDPAEVSAYFSS
jgi:beta-N-acetylhexosaminidase